MILLIAINVKIAVDGKRFIKWLWKNEWKFSK
jgi:hypothetical protein